MDKEYTVKMRKQPDGKRPIVGNIKPGRYGPQLGLRVTDEFRALVGATETGNWVNLDVYPKDDQYPAGGGSVSRPQAADDSEVPF